jgi:hypothetical protein
MSAQLNDLDSNELEPARLGQPALAVYSVLQLAVVAEYQVQESG